MSTTRTFRTAVAGLAVTSVATLAPFAASPASAITPHTVTITTRASTDGNGGQADGHGAPVLTPDGRFLAFVDTTTQSTWVEDLWSGQSEMVSVTAAGVKSDVFAMPLGISADGNRVLFRTAATNLVGGAHTKNDLYVRDRKADTTTQVNIGANGALAESANVGANLDDGGKQVTWTGADGKIYLRDLTASATQRVDVSSAEVPSNGASSDAELSGDGKHVVFTSLGGNLVTGDANGVPDVFQRNLATGTTDRISLAGAGQSISAASYHGSPSYDGRYVTFVSASPSVVNGDANGVSDVFVRDTVASATTRVSLGGASTSPNAESDWPAISRNGSSVVFMSAATNLVAGVANGKRHFYVRNRATSSTTVADQSLGLNAGNQDGMVESAISGDGSIVAFRTTASNMVEGDTNGNPDVFVRRVVSMGPHTNLSQLAYTTLQRFGAPMGTVNARISDLENGRLTIEHFIATRAHAPEWAAHREPVTRLYTAFFDRAPDLSGLEYWSGKHAKGTDLAVIAAKFAQSSEFKTKYGKVDDTAFVKLVYTNVLQRPADAAGLSHWIAKLKGGLTRGDVMVQFSESSEGKRRMAPSVDATLIGLGMLGKMPTKADVATAKFAHVHAGGAEGVARFFLDSAAYASTVAPAPAP